MPDSKADQKTTYPLPAYNFRVTVDGQAASFTEVSGLMVEYETVTYHHGFSRWEGGSITRIPKMARQTITLKKGTTASGTFLADWLTAEPPSSRAMAISLCDEAGAPVVVWHVKDAVPVKLSAPSFVALSNEIAIETLEVLATGISVEHV